ncbi:ester cyclase [Acidobacteriota bacterium]
MKKFLMIFLLFLIVCFMLSCQDTDAIAELEEFKAQAEVEQQNMELAKRYIEAINDGNFDAFKEFLSSDYAIYSPSGYPEPTSREKLIENYKGVQEAFSEFIWNIEDIIAARDKVICRIMIRATSKSGVPGLPETEKEVKFSLITIMRMDNGKVVEEWQEDDQLGFARQLGMELKPKEE